MADLVVFLTNLEVTKATIVPASKSLLPDCISLASVTRFYPRNVPVYPSGQDSSSVDTCPTLDL